MEGKEKNIKEEGSTGRKKSYGKKGKPKDRRKERCKERRKEGGKKNYYTPHEESVLFTCQWI